MRAYSIMIALGYGNRPKTEKDLFVYILTYFLGDIINRGYSLKEVFETTKKYVLI